MKINKRHLFVSGYLTMTLLALLPYQNCGGGGGGGGGGPSMPSESKPFYTCNIKIVNSWDSNMKTPLSTEVVNGQNKVSEAEELVALDSCRYYMASWQTGFCSNHKYDFVNGIMEFTDSKGNVTKYSTKDACQMGFPANTCANVGGYLAGAPCDGDYRCCSNQCDLEKKTCVGPDLSALSQCVKSAETCSADTDCCSGLKCVPWSSGVKLCSPISETKYTLTISSPSGGSIKTSSFSSTYDQGISCPNWNCSREFYGNQLIKLEATAESGYQFKNWTGDCDSKGQVMMSADKTCGAVFEKKPTYTLTLNFTGSGSISGSSSISCSTSPCSYTFLEGTSVSLWATPAAGYEYGGWSGDCATSASVVMDKNKSCTYSFNQKKYRLTVNKSYPVLAVVSSPSGISMTSSDYSSFYDFPALSTVSLGAGTDYNSGYSGVSYSADCAGGVFTMDRDRTCTISATVDNKQLLSIFVSGSSYGMVESYPAGIKCGMGYNTCMAWFDTYSTVYLSTKLYSTYSYKFSGFNYPCSGGSVSMSPGTKSCTATFSSCSPSGVSCYSYSQCCSGYCSSSGKCL